jgi:hypothetical protein
MALVLGSLPYHSIGPSRPIPPLVSAPCIAQATLVDSAGTVLSGAISGGAGYNRRTES